ncbi:ABC transporter permease [Herbidospora mongoliensis]|uniref:ABC transporter permease n=1 Tax=Herbidospora mongoliensis TaxID=688067 RepID=UPI00082BE552|nr:ABC transporter permease [Herbidospora mongoliensis]
MIRAEWTKFRTLPGLPWLVLLLVVLTVGTGAAATALVPCCDVLPSRVSLAGVQAGQIAAVALAVGMVAGEYSTGMIVVTLLAVPHRGRMLAAKALLVGGVTLAGALVAITTSAVIGPGVTPTAFVGSIVYLVLVSLLALGVAAAVRDTAVAMGVALGILYGFPLVIRMIQDPVWQERLAWISPMEAGMAVQGGIASIGPWAGLAVLGVWAVGALAVGRSRVGGSVGAVV